MALTAPLGATAGILGRVNFPLASRLVAGLSFLLHVACAAAASSPPDDYRKLFEAGAANGAFPALSVGLIDGTSQSMWFYGSGGAAPDADSAYELGSATDLFAGLLLGQAAIEGRVRLSTTLGALFPSGFPWHDRALAETSLLALASQDAGLPAQPANLFPGDALDPYADYGDSDLSAWLAHQDSAVGARGGYSILHAPVLALALSRVSGSAFDPLLTKRVLTPLGMTHTGFADSEALLPAHAYGRQTRHWHFAALAAAAGLRSTLPDLLAFVRANLQPEGSSLRGALLLSRQAHAEGPVGGLGLGWNVHDVPSGNQQWPLVWRASQTGGFSIFIGFRTDRQRGLVLLCNSLADLAPIGIAWLSGEPAPNAPSAPYVPTGGSTDDRYPGLYRLASGIDATVRADSDGLRIQLRGQPAWRLHAVAEDVFLGPTGANGVTFVRNIDAVGGLVLHAGGAYVAADRLTPRAPKLERPEFPVAADKLQEFAGDFAIDATTQLRVARRGDLLAAQLTGSEPMLMRAYAADRFADADGVNQLLYRRDEQGRIDALVIDLAGGERTARRIDWSAPSMPAYTAPSVDSAADP